MKYPGMVIHWIGVMIAGIWISSTVIEVLWPNIENSVEIKTTLYRIRNESNHHN